jgi:ubiquitin C-terminal hydrolase
LVRLLRDCDPEIVNKVALHLRDLTITTQTVAPSLLHRALSRSAQARSAQFGRPWVQEDAEEGIITMIEAMNISAVRKMFKYKYNVCITCNACGHSLKKVDENYFLKVHPADLQNTTLTQYIFSNTTNINDYRCDNCKQMGHCVRVNRLGYIPEVFIIVFEKYLHKWNIQYPSSLTFIGTDGQSRLRYEPVAQIEHSGGQRGGHYWAIVNRGNFIYKMNDHNVSQTRFMATNNTYIVVYCRKEN